MDFVVDLAATRSRFPARHQLYRRKGFSDSTPAGDIAGGFTTEQRSIPRADDFEPGNLRRDLSSSAAGAFRASFILPFAGGIDWRLAGRLGTKSGN